MYAQCFRKAHTQRQVPGFVCWSLPVTMQQEQQEKVQHMQEQ